MIVADERLIWVDIETTGLDPHKEMILEVGFTVTDLELNVTESKSWLIWNSEYDKLCVEAKIDPFVWEMHKKSGLWKDAKQNGLPFKLIYSQILVWLNKMEVKKTEPLCGSSVQFDRSWFDELMPSVTERFSYRNIDISTIKELCMRYNPILYSKLEEETSPAKIHRVIPDIYDTIDEFEFYRDSFLFWKD